MFKLFMHAELLFDFSFYIVSVEGNTDSPTQGKMRDLSGLFTDKMMVLHNDSHVITRSASDVAILLNIGKL